MTLRLRGAGADLSVGSRSRALLAAVGGRRVLCRLYARPSTDRIEHPVVTC